MIGHLINIIHQHVDVLKNRIVNALQHVFRLVRAIDKYLVSIVNQALAHRLHFCHFTRDFKFRNNINQIFHDKNFCKNRKKCRTDAKNLYFYVSNH